VVGISQFLLDQHGPDGMQLAVLTKQMGSAQV
jgi:hypothetical protein